MAEIPETVRAEFAELAAVLAAVDDVVVDAVARYHRAVDVLTSIDGLRDDHGDVPDEVWEESGTNLVCAWLAVLWIRLQDAAEESPIPPEDLDSYGIPDRGYTEALAARATQEAHLRERLLTHRADLERLRRLEDTIFELTVHDATGEL